ncbi:hypothetical protein O3P69_001288 [Scylla paramamosain]|uniref:Neurotransmitter-gated ion-channel ligand-binding domain-containing protein n=1 Tax=Scylla paramamosain TaxID=85552 RepID=A0AAW0UPM4_SCYPA
MCFAGTPRGRRVFRLRGLSPKLTEDVSPLAFSFVLARHPGNGVYFHGFRKLHIKKVANTSRWCLSGDELHETLCVNVHRLPVGRHEWMAEQHHQQQQQQQQQQHHSGVMELSLSTCADHQYTCSDATCVQLAKVCDFEFDCSDQSDEVGCTTAVLPQSYLHSYPPSVPLPVLAAVTVKRIINFDLLSMTFQINLNVTLIWKDHRVTFNHLQVKSRRRVVLIEDEQRKVWGPKLVVEDTVGDTQTSLELLAEKRGEGRPTHLGYEYPGAENPLKEVIDLRSTVYCKYTLLWYPWDVQRCSVRLKVTNVRESGLLLNESSGVLNCPTLLEEYKVESCTLGKEEAPTNTITVYLQLSRRYEYHLFTTFLPTSLLLILGYGTLLLPVESINERGTMSLTTLLVFISLYTETNNSLPSTSYLKYIDVWFVFSITYLSVIIIVHLASFSHAPIMACELTGFGLTETPNLELLWTMATIDGGHECCGWQHAGWCSGRVEVDDERCWSVERFGFRVGGLEPTSCSSGARGRLKSASGSTAARDGSEPVTVASGAATGFVRVQAAGAWNGKDNIHPTLSLPSQQPSSRLLSASPAFSSQHKESKKGL